jgi:OOP family OmpA-OmpF porin
MVGNKHPAVAGCFKARAAGLSISKPSDIARLKCKKRNIQSLIKMKINLTAMPMAFVILMGSHGVLQAAEDLTSSWAISPMLSYIKADDDRRAGNDTGLLLGLSKSINESWDMELSFVSDKLAFNSGFDDFEQRGLMLDGLYFFDRQNSLQGYAVMGAGLMETTVGGVSNTNPMFNAGVGVMRKITDYGIALRADIRYRVELDNNTVPYESAFGDLMLNVGLRIPFGKNTSSAPVVSTTPAEVNTPAPAVVTRPDLDTDNDGVLDDADRCPASAAAVSVDIHGCELQASFILDGVNFERDSAVLTPGAREALQDVAATLKKNPGHKVEVAGYTDERGPADFNQRLSEQRALAVKVCLESMGVAAKQMIARGYGAADPVADNSTLAGRSQNRRVELHILN